MAAKDTLENTYRRGILNDEKVREWEDDLRVWHATQLSRDEVKVVNFRVYATKEDQLGCLAAVGLALVADRRELLRRVETLEAALLAEQQPGIDADMVKGCEGPVASA